MKNHIFKVFSSIVCLLGISINSFCMEDATGGEKPDREIVRIFSEDTINKYYNKKKECFFSTLTKENVIQKTDEIKNKLNHYKIDIDTQKNKLFEKVCKEHNIGFEDWNAYMDLTKDIQKEVELKMSLAREQFIHDEKIPQWFLDMLKAQLKKVRIHPTAVDIICIDKCIDKKIDIRLEAASYNWKSTELGLLLDFTKSARMAIYCANLNKDNEYLVNGYCMFLANHIKLLSTTNVFAVLKVFERNILLSEEELLLERILGLQFFLDIALESSCAASCIKRFYIKENRFRIDLKGLDGDNKQAHFISNYNLLASIELFWKQLEWLEEYKKNLLGQ